MKGLILRDHEVRALLTSQRVLVVRPVTAMSRDQAEWLTPQRIGSVPIAEYRDEWPARCGPGVSLAHPSGGPLGFVRCPWGAAGERRYVRETWAPLEYEGIGVSLMNGAVYRATWPPTMDERHDAGLIAEPERWRSAVAMPRAASRLTVEVESTKVLRLHTITPEQAAMTGVVGGGWYEAKSCPIAKHPSEVPAELWNFAIGWDERYGGSPWRCWEDNPWCWLGEMKVVGS